MCHIINILNFVKRRNQPTQNRFILRNLREDVQIKDKNYYS